MRTYFYIGLFIVLFTKHLQAQSDSLKRQRFSFGMGYSMFVNLKPTVSLLYSDNRDCHSRPSFELDFFTRVYLSKYLFFKPAVSYAKFNYFSSETIDYWKGSPSLGSAQNILSANLKIHESISKFKLYLPIGIEFSEGEDRYFLEAGFGYNQSFSVKDQINLKVYNTTLSTEELNNIIDRRTNYSADIHTHFLFRVATGVSFEIFKSLHGYTSFFIERVNYNEFIPQLGYNYETVFYYCGATIGLMLKP